MRSLVLTTSDAGAGHLKKARIADKVVGMAQRLVCGPPLTASEIAVFFGSSGNFDDIARGRYWDLWPTLKHAEPGKIWPGLIEVCAAFDTIELWIDPLPNAQLILLQVLEFLRPHPEIVEKLVLLHADAAIGGLGADTASWRPAPHKVESRHLETARRAWDAFRQPTPRAWFGLLNDDLDALPYLRRAVTKLLAELPATGTGLGAMEMTVLRVIAPGDVGPVAVLSHKDAWQVFDYWEIGQMLDRLARCPVPPVQGLEEGPFTLDMHERARHQRYKSSKLSLSALGRALVENTDDFSRHNPIHHLWGGTELTNDCLWRWDATNNALVAPD